MILLGDHELRERFREIVSENIGAAAELIATGETRVPAETIVNVISFIEELKKQSSPQLQLAIDFILRGIEDGFLLHGIGVKVD